MGNLLIVVDTHDTGQGTCRTWALSVAFLHEDQGMSQPDDLVKKSKVARSPSFLH